MNRQAIRHWLAGAMLLTTAVEAEQWLEVKPADWPITVTASGTIRSSNVLKFGPPPSRSWRTTITEITREGTRVEAGDVLVKFDASASDDRVRELNGQLAAKRSELESLLETQSREIEQEQVDLAAAKSRAEKASRKAAQPAELYASIEYRKLVEERDLAQELYRREQELAKLSEQVRQATVAELEADIARLESELRGAQRELESFTIRAPRPGLVIIGTDREGSKLDVNSNVNPGLVVVELVDENELVAEVEVPEFAAAQLKRGQPARIEVEAAGSREIEGEVLEVASIVRRQSRFSQAMVRDLTVSLGDEPLAGLRTGMSAKVTVTVDLREDALAVPSEALVYRDGAPGVLLRGAGWRAVEVAETSNGLRIVSAGIEAGDEVRVQ